MIQLGTVAAIGFDEFDPAEWLGCWRRLGCQVVQAYRNQTRQVTIAQMRDALAAGEMPCDSLHGVFGEQFDPSCPDEATRRFAVDTYRREGELCLALGGKLVVVHCSTLRPSGVSAQEKQLRTTQLKRTIAELGEFGTGCGIRYAFENLPRYHAFGSDVGELAGVVKEVAAPNTGICFDSGHANMVGDPVQAARASDGQMIYAHISDNDGQNDSHELISYGSIDAEALARAFHHVRYQGTFMMEVFYSARRLRELLDAGAAERLARLLRIANGQE